MAIKMACPGCGRTLLISTPGATTCGKCGTTVRCDSNGKVIGKEIRRK